jgi:antirestriction protein ArdC
MPLKTPWSPAGTNANIATPPGEAYLYVGIYVIALDASIGKQEK